MPFRLVFASLFAALLAFGSPVAAQTLGSLPLKGADGATIQEAGATDTGGRFYPGHLVFGWTGSALKALAVDGSGNMGVTVSGGPTATGQTTANTALAGIVTNTAHPGSGTMTAVSTTSVTNGFALPVGVIGTRIYLPTSSESITYTVEPAASCGTSTPGPTVTVAGPAGVDENLTGQVVCVTAAAGSVRARGY